MRRVIAIIVSVIWALWLGGLVTLFIAVQTLFRTFAQARPVAGTGAAGIFHVFERYQLVLAGVGLVVTFIWRIAPLGRPAAAGLKTALFAALALATVAGAVSTLLITPRIDVLHERGMTSGPEFGRLHGTSMLLYSAEAIILLLAAPLLTATIVRDADARSAPSA